jgi:hypothetical protein
MLRRAFAKASHLLASNSLVVNSCVSERFRFDVYGKVVLYCADCLNSDDPNYEIHLSEWKIIIYCTC